MVKKGPRFSLVDYAGAISRLPFAKAERLAKSPSWGFMPKSDGSYAELGTDSQGRIKRITLRTGESATHEEAGGLYGVAIGIPDSVLVAELEVYSEAAVRIRETRKWANAPVFDIIRCAGRYVAREPMQVRYSLLERWQCSIGTQDWWWQDSRGYAHDKVTHKFVRPTPKDLRRVPLLPLVTGTPALEKLWHSYVEVGGGEGLVAVDLGAPIGGRGAKKKIKKHDTVDCTVVELGKTGVRVTFAGEVFRIPCKRWLPKLAVGDVVEVKGDGFLESRPVPRFARIVRVRSDLRGTVS